MTDVQTGQSGRTAVAGHSLGAAGGLEQFERARVLLPLDQQEGVSLLRFGHSGGVTRAPVQRLRARILALRCGVRVELRREIGAR